VRALRTLLLMAVAWGGVAQAQEVQTSPAPDAVAVTIYRAPYRSATEKLSLDYLAGYALITETRTIRVPEGRAVIRFEGVASGILPESAIVTGLPQGVREKNLDGELLSAASLYNRGYARPVTLRRTRDGKTVEERAIIRSGPAGSAIVETTRGFEVLNCGPTQDAIAYDAVPQGLSAKPTLSVETQSSQAGTATVTLSYLAWGFDWQANYVATLHEGAKSADLFAWVTLASTDMTSFEHAQTMVMAGKVNRTTGRTSNPYESADTFEFRCYLPLDQEGERLPPPPPPVMPAPPPPPPAPAMAEAIIVTGSRVRQVVQEDLGDLKAYRVPDATTVAARSQKQVALLAKDAVPVSLVYASTVSFGGASQPQLRIRALNKVDKGLGLPLPAGPVALFERQNGRELLVGESFTDDKALGEEVELKFSTASNLTLEFVARPGEPGRSPFELVLRNANPFPIRFEAEFNIDENAVKNPSTPFTKRNGRNLWATTVPANGTANLRYTVLVPR
jgi:hypothetical protein